MTRFNEELCAPSERRGSQLNTVKNWRGREVVVTVRDKKSKQGAWGWEKSKAMHEARTNRIDLREARRKARLQAKAERAARKARVRIKNGERGQDVA